MLIEKTFPEGIIVISDIIDGYMVNRRYVGYTKREAKALFKQEMKEKESNHV